MIFNSKKVFLTNSFEESQKTGEDLIRRLHLDQGVTLSKNVIALYGELGSGKTTFVQGIARGLGIKRRIISPTFIIIRSYNIKNTRLRRGFGRQANKKLKMFYHIDLYRIKSDRDIVGLGIKEILNDEQNIVAVEWAEKIGRLLPKRRVDIRFAYASENQRRITINIKNQILNIKNISLREISRRETN